VSSRVLTGQVIKWNMWELINVYFEKKKTFITSYLSGLKKE